MAAHFRSFLARLTRGAPRPEIEAVARNLEHLLNTRKGCGSVVAELGLGDYEAAPNTHHAVLLLRVEIERLVRRAEPRLCEPRVTLLGGLGTRHIIFELQGKVGAESHVILLDIDTTTRHVTVTLERAQ